MDLTKREAAISALFMALYLDLGFCTIVGVAIFFAIDQGGLTILQPIGQAIAKRINPD